MIPVPSPMTQLLYRIKDVEARPHGMDIEVPLDRAFLSSTLSGPGPGQNGHDHDHGHYHHAPSSTKAAGVKVDVERSEAALKANLLCQSANVLLRGTLLGHLALECQRCLGPAQVPLDLQLHMTFVPTGTLIPRGKEGEEGFELFDPDDIDYAHHDKDVVDLTPVLREYILLSLPITVVCDEDCRGLCPSCGGDLNTTACACDRTVSLSPFAALKNLKI